MFKRLRIPDRKNKKSPSKLTSAIGVCVCLVPWSLYRHLQQHGEPEAAPLGGHLCGLHVFLFAHLHSNRWVHLYKASTSVYSMCFTWKLLIMWPLYFSRCVRLHDVWTSGCFWYFDVVSRKWRGHDHCQTTFWNINHHYLSHYSSSGEVSDTRVGLYCVSCCVF